MIEILNAYPFLQDPKWFYVEAAFFFGTESFDKLQRNVDLFLNAVHSKEKKENVFESLDSFLLLKMNKESNLVEVTNSKEIFEASSQSSEKESPKLVILKNEIEEDYIICLYAREITGFPNLTKALTTIISLYLVLDLPVPPRSTKLMNLLLSFIIGLPAIRFSKERMKYLFDLRNLAPKNNPVNNNDNNDADSNDDNDDDDSDAE